MDQTQPQQPASTEATSTPRSARARLDIYERAWRLFVSLRLMVVLMALFSVAMALGTFINPKESALADIERAFADRPWIVSLYRLFELYAPFKSWWFLLIILLLALNNLASSIERLPRIFQVVRRPQRRLTDSLLRGLGQQRRLPGATEASAVEGAFRAAGYRTVREVDGDGTEHLFAERGAWTRFGVWGVHLALLVICFGAVFGRIGAFEGMIDLPENGGVASFLRMREPDGTVIPRPLVDEAGERFALRCDDFTLDKFKDGSARRFSSQLTVLDGGGKELHAKRIIVNDPLEWGAMKFYQASYSERPEQSRAKMVLVDTRSGERREVAASPEAPIIASDGVRFEVLAYREEFGGQGPAVQLRRQEPDGAGLKAGEPFWVFQRFPKFDAEFRGDRWAVQFGGLEPLYVTGIQVGYDPSIPWIYFGCVFLWVSLFVTFWTTHRRLWARRDAAGWTLAGAAHRNKERFAREFAALVDGLPGGAAAGGAPTALSEPAGEPA